MAKKRRHRHGGRTTPKGTRPLGFEPRGQEPGDWSYDEPAELDLTRSIRRAGAEAHPLSLLALASSLLDVADPRSLNPFDRSESARAMDRRELIQSFLDADVAESSLMLFAIATMSNDELERGRIHRELESRQYLLPSWAAGLGEVEAYRAVEMVHVLDDGDDVIVGARLSTGEELTIVAYIDHNLGTMMKDGFVVPDGIDGLVELMKASCDDADTTFRDIPLADARVRITEAIDLGARTFPPFESDTWPAARQLVEWITRLLPLGGHGYEHPEWSDEAIDALGESFLASELGRPFAGATNELDVVIEFGASTATGDPMRWSPVAVELILTDWVPRKVVAPVDLLDGLPEVLRAFVRYCHRERGIRQDLTAETLAAVDRYEPEYRSLIRSPRRQGPNALPGSMGFDPEEDPWSADEQAFDEYSFEEVMLGFLSQAVGGDEALATLDTTPLPDEEFAWAGIPDDIADRVRQVVVLCDGCCDRLIDAEYRTACRRLISRIAVCDPQAFRRRGSVEGAAAAICLIIGKVNDLFSYSGRGMLVKDLTAEFGVAHGTASGRAHTLLKAGGFEQRSYGDICLGSTEFLVSSERRRIVERRDHYLKMQASD